jgi:hypothetical protein
MNKCQVQRMHGAVPSLPQYAFMAWCSVKEKSTGITLPLPLHFWGVRFLDNVCGGDIQKHYIYLFIIFCSFFYLHLGMHSYGINRH